MTEAKVPIKLNKGLDLASPAMSRAAGSLINCLNYEYTTADGTRRIDGYERYDGWVGGSAVDYWSVTVTLLDATSYLTASPGSLIHKLEGGILTVFGVFVAYNDVTSTLIYVPIRKDTALLSVGDSIVVDRNSDSDMTVATASIPRYQLLSTSDYISEVRSFGALLRNTTVTSPHAVCGLHWFRNNLVEVRDAPYLTFSGVTDDALNNGDMFDYEGQRYIVIDKLEAPLTVYVEPLGTSPRTPSSDIEVVGKDGTVISSETPSAVAVEQEGGDWAYMVCLTTPSTSEDPHTAILMRRSIVAKFYMGSAPDGRVLRAGDVVTIGSPVNGYKAFVKSVSIVSGDWDGSTAEGYVTLVPSDPQSDAESSGTGAKNNIFVGDTVYDPEGNIVFDLGEVERTALAGSNKLRANESHYTFETYNFYGDIKSTEAYGASGAARAVWFKAYMPTITNKFRSSSPSPIIPDNFSYGNILTNPVTADDKPKWVSMHGGSRLALGTQGGEVALSVAGEPHNYSGLEGAASLSSGDELTGMLEGVGDSTILFGRKSIRRITGILNDELAMKTISGSSGALPYTCVLVGRSPVYADQSGITTLEQSETYSDFVGERMSKQVEPELRPKLLSDFSTTEMGGVYCAIPVRKKNQYRLFLNSGRVYSMNLSSEGPIFGLSSYSNDGSVRVPFAWSSQTQDSGKETIHVVWDSFSALSSPIGSDDEEPVDPNAPLPITGSVTPSSVTGVVVGSDPTAVVESDPVTVTATGGTGAPKSYTWSKVSGTTLTLTDANGPTTTFADLLNKGWNTSATYRCTITDGTFTSYVDVAVFLEYVAAEVPLTSSVSPNPVSGSQSGSAATALITSAAVTASPSNGTGAPKTYSWAKVSGDTLTITSPSSATTTFSSTLNRGTSKSAIYRVTVSDGTYTSTSDVTVNLEYLSSIVPLTVTLSPSSVFGFDTSGGSSMVISSGATTATPANGTGGTKTYSWSRVSGAVLTVNSPSSATTTFSAVVFQSTVVEAVYRVTVNDGTYSATADVSVRLEFYV